MKQKNNETKNKEKKYILFKVKIILFISIILFWSIDIDNDIKIVQKFIKIVEKYEIFNDEDYLYDKQKQINLYNITAENMHTIHIGITINDVFSYPCIVLITSLLESRNPTTIYHVHIVTPKVFSSTQKSKINSLMEKYGKNVLNISFIHIDDIKLGNKILGIQEYRLIFPSLFPDIDKILYCDADIINFEDLTELYNMNLDDNIYFRGSLDHCEMVDLLKPYGITKPERYINSGVLLMNLKILRKNNVQEQMLNILRIFTFPFSDQTLINFIGYNHIEPFPLKYACFNFLFYFTIVNYNKCQTKKYRESSAAIKEAYNKPFLLHFAATKKPFRGKDRDVFDEYWWYFARKTDFYEEILSYAKIKNRKIIKLLKKIPRSGGLLNRAKA